MDWIPLRLVLWSMAGVEEEEEKKKKKKKKKRRRRRRRKGRSRRKKIERNSKISGFRSGGCL